MQEETYSYKGQVQGLESEALKVPDPDCLGSHLGRVSAILDVLREQAGRSKEGRIWSILATEAEKLLALAIGLDAAPVLIPERFRKIEDV